MDILTRLLHIARSSVSSARRQVEEEFPHVGNHRWSENSRSASGSAFGDGGHGSRPKTTLTPEDAALAKNYANLEVPYGSDLKTVHAAWRQLMKKYHPDLHCRDAEKRRIANELTARLTQAYRDIEEVVV
jgi:DnaJ-domain-containing protein 1